MSGKLVTAIQTWDYVSWSGSTFTVVPVVLYESTLPLGSDITRCDSLPEGPAAELPMGTMGGDDWERLRIDLTLVDDVLTAADLLLM